MKKLLFTFLITAITAFTGAAQKYIVDVLLSDSAQVWEIVGEGSSETAGLNAFKIPNGEEVTLTRLLEGSKFYGAFTKDGKEYCLAGNQIVLSDDNPEGTESLFPGMRTEGKYSSVEHFFATMTPYYIIALLFILAIAMMFLGNIGPLRKIALFAVPACILVATALEIWGYATLGSDVFWWCDKERYGFWGSLLRAIPFVIFVAFQILSIKMYENLLFGDDSTEEISIKPMALSMGLCIPITLVVALLGAFFWKNYVDVVCMITFFVSLFAGTLKTFRENIHSFGLFRGLLLTSFIAVYLVGALIAGFGLLVLLFKLIVQILIVIAMVVGGIILVSVMGSTRRYRGSDGHIYEEDGLGNRRRIS